MKNVSIKYNKTRRALIIGVVLLVVALVFISYALQHPELSFPWSQKITFMLYGAYVWFLFKFLIDIPLLKRIQAANERNDKEILRPIIFIMMAVVFLIMEFTGDEVTGYTIVRGFVVVGSFDIAIESLCKERRNHNKQIR